MNIRVILMQRVSIIVFGAVFALQVAAQTTNMLQAYRTMEMAKSFKGRGDLSKAESLFQIVVDNSPKESNIHQEAWDELNYYLPLARVQRLLRDGKTLAAERELFSLQQAFEHQPVRRQTINRIMSGLRSKTASTDTGSAGDTAADERYVTHVVRTALDSYYRENNRFPTSRISLLDVLAFDSPPLDSIEIGHYSSNGVGYLLVLRSKKDANQTITLQYTGLLQHSGAP